MKYILTKKHERKAGSAERRLPTVRRTCEGPLDRAPLHVKEYILTTLTAEKRRCCLLRWVKDVEMDMDSVTFALTQLDSTGGEIATRTLTMEHIPHTRIGKSFSPNRAYPVEPNCAAIRIQVLHVTAGAFTYRYDCPDTDEAVVEYATAEAWNYGEDTAKKDGLKEGISRRARSKRGGRVGFLWAMATLTVIVLVLALAKPYIAYLFPSKKQASDSVTGLGAETTSGDMEWDPDEGAMPAVPDISFPFGT